MGDPHWKRGPSLGQVVVNAREEFIFAKTLLWAFLCLATSSLASLASLVRVARSRRGALAEVGT